MKGFNKKTTIFISLIIILIIITCSYIFIIRSDKFRGNINLNNYDIITDISQSTQMEVLGNYMFLYAPHSSEIEDLSSYNSYLIVTDSNLNIKEVIDLGAYYQYIELQDNGDILVYNNLNDVHVIPYIDNQYQNIQDYSLETLPESPYVGVIPPGSIYVDQERYIGFKNEPYSNVDDYTYLVVDFIQNVNTESSVLPAL